VDPRTHRTQRWRGKEIPASPFRESNPGHPTRRLIIVLAELPPSAVLCVTLNGTHDMKFRNTDEIRIAL
jgi:hypothetical protein